MSLYDAVRELPLVVDGYALDAHEYVVGPEFTRKTTVVRLSGGGRGGAWRGRHLRRPPSRRRSRRAGRCCRSPASGRSRRFSRHLETLPLFDSEPEMPAFLDYRRWAFESAALDLALRQAGRSLGDVVGREPRPVTFVASGGLGDPPTTARLRAFLERYPGLRFKLDARPDWTDEIFAELQQLGCVDSIDLKGQYSGTVVDNPPDPVLYRRVIEAFPDAWLEDPALTPETECAARAARRPCHVGRDHPLRRGHRGAPLAAAHRQREAVPLRHGRAALRDLRVLRGAAGSARTAAASGSSSVGRGHIQLLAALFHPDTPNDVAPGGYNATEPPDGLPTSPLTVRPRATGFQALAIDEGCDLAGARAPAGRGAVPRVGGVARRSRWSSTGGTTPTFRLGDELSVRLPSARRVRAARWTRSITGSRSSARSSRSRFRNPSPGAGRATSSRDRGRCTGGSTETRRRWST